MKPLSTLILLIFPVFLFSQRADNWVFGNYAQVSFSTGIPLAGPLSAMYQLEGCSSISDQNGRLQFYSNGISVWSANHAIMPNGTGLWGNWSSTQSSMIVPFQQDAARYYVFTVDALFGTHGLCYSVVNMNLNNGLGDIEIKNVQLTAFVMEKVTCVNHCNGKDVWVITRDYRNNDMLAYLVTSAGIQPPVVSNTGSTFNHSIGYLKVSPNGSKIADANLFQSLELFDFNASTGQVSGRKVLMKSPGQTPYGAEFSPDSRLLYVTNSLQAGLNSYRHSLCQFTSLDSTETKIRSTITELDSVYFPYFGYLNALQLGPDGKVYMSSTGNYHVAVIQDPNRTGTNCNYSRNGPLLTNGANCLAGLPDFNQSYVKGSFNFTTLCDSTLTYFRYSPSSDVQSVKWDFDDPVSGAANFSTLDSPQHIFSVPGVYTVKLVTYQSCRNDTFIKKVTIDPFKVKLGPDKSVCADSAFLLDPHAGTNRLYKWQDNSTNPTFSSTVAGLYWVEVSRTDGSCVTRDSILITAKPNPLLNLGKDSILCEPNHLTLDATNPGAVYKWQDNSNGPMYTVRKSGRYFVRVNLNGCIATDTVLIETKKLPGVYMVTKTGICPGMDIQLTPVYQNTENASYLWNTGSTEQSIMVQTAGRYQVDVSNNCGTSSAAIDVFNGACKLFVPSGFTPNNDGKNDLFKAEYGENVILFKLEVYNRWGQRVFHSNDIRQGWDGRINGILQPAGVYAWKITYTLYNEPSVKFLKGTTTLIN